MKKVIAWLLLITLTATAAIGGTLAYLTDRDSEANVFTVGDVKIDLNEDFQQGSQLTPGVEITKKPTITNVGKNDAWVWYTYAIPEALDGDLVLEFTQNTGWASPKDTGKTVTLDGVTYKLYAVLYQQKLAPENKTPESLTSVMLPAYVDINPDGQLHKVEAGVTTDLGWNINSGYPVIYISAYAIQTEGFNSVEEAYAAYQTQWGDNGAEYNSNVIMVSSTDDIREAMKVEGAKIVLANDILVDDDKGTGYCFYAKYDCEIDLNGNDIIVDLPGKEFYGVFYGCKGAQLDISGYGKISIIGGVGQFVSVTGGVNIPADGSTVNIYGGNWKQESPDFTSENNNYVEGLYANRGGIVNIYGGIFNWENFEKYTMNESRNGMITVYGGTFINFDPRVSHDSDGSYVAEGYTVISETQANGDVWYTVVKG